MREQGLREINLIVRAGCGKTFVVRARALILICAHKLVRGLHELQDVSLEQFSVKSRV